MNKYKKLISGVGENYRLMQSEFEREVKEKTINMRVNFRKNEEKILRRYLELKDLTFSYDWAKYEYLIKDKMGRTIRLPQHIFLQDNFSEIAISEIEKHLGGNHE